MPKCHECGKEIPSDPLSVSACTKKLLLCEACAWTCYEIEVLSSDDTDCDVCPYREDDIDYDKLEQDYPDPTDEEIKEALNESHESTPEAKP